MPSSAFSSYNIVREYLSFNTTVSLVAASFILYVLGLGYYRLYLSPLASVPGPKLAALTGWVEAYYELLHGEGGQFMLKYREWHEKYGPIIRITPYEVHIQDASFFDTLYATNRASMKRKEHVHRFNNPTSAFVTPDHALHRLRRGALNPFFSKRAISERAQNIQKQMDIVSKRLKTEFQNTGRILVVNEMWGCFATDIITEYCFERRYDFIREPNFKALFVKSLIDLLEGVHWVTQFPWLSTIMNWMPDAIIAWIDPRMESVTKFNNEMLAQVSEVIKNSDSKEKHNTIFASIIRSDMPRAEVTQERLQHEATALVGAGLETTMRTLTVSVYHITDNPSTYHRLRDELFTAIPDPEKIPSWESLQQLPFLTACIEESLRLSYGLAQRSPRLHDHDITYGDFVIPKGTIISMNIYDVSHDENIFPNSFEYRPERWLGNPRSSDGRRLSRYMVSFGRGTRSCVGMQLAYAELFIGLATIFRRFSFEIYDTDRTDIDLGRDRFVPRPVKKSHGVRVLVK
ncbi:cytochrome protein [Xylaria curta]|nr:cytochrome protein [Xylaria curta]